MSKSIYVLRRGAGVFAAILVTATLAGCAQSPLQGNRCGHNAGTIGGAVLGGAGGGLLGNQFGKGSGNAAMTAVGAVGGVIAGAMAGGAVDEGRCAYQEQQRPGPAYIGPPPVQYVQPAPVPQYQQQYMAAPQYIQTPQYQPQYQAPQYQPQYQPQPLPPTGVNIQACGGNTGISCNQAGAQYGRAPNYR